jgi:MFS family permease
MLLGLFLPIYAMHCVEQVYFVYGNVLQGYGLPPQTTGLILGSFFVSIMLTRPLGGWLLEGFGIRRTLILSSVTGFVGCSVLFATRSVPMLFLGRILAGASFGVYTMALFSHLALSVPERVRGASFALAISGGILPTATITPLGEWLIARSQIGMFLALGPMLCVVCWFLGRRVGSDAVRKGEGDSAEGDWGRYRDLLSCKPFMFLIVTGLMISLTDAVVVCMSLFTAEHNIVASWFLATSSVAGIVVRVPGSRIMNTLPRQLVLAPCGMLMAGAVFMVSVFPSVGTFICGGILFGIGIGAGFPMMISMVSDTLPQSLIPKGTAVLLSLYDLGWFVTPFLVGLATPIIGIAWTFRLLTALSFAALALLVFMYWLPFWMAGRPKKAPSHV